MMRKRLLTYGALLLGFTALGLYFSYPLHEHFSSAIPYNGKGSYSPNPVAGDHLQILYFLWLIARNFFSGNLWECFEFAVEGASYCPLFFYFPISYLLAPLTYFGSPVVAYNLFLISSFGLCGLFTFLLVRSYTRESWGALAAALLFTFCAYRLSQLFGGHSNGFIAFYLPLGLYAFENGRKFLFLLVLIGLYCADLQLLYFFLLVFSPYFLLRLGFQISSFKNFLRQAWPVIAGYLIIFFLFMLLKENFLSATLQGGGRQIEEIKSYTWFAFFRKSPGSVEGNLYLGWIPFLCLGLGALAFLLRRPHEKPLRLKSVALWRAFYFVCAGLLTAFLSLGMFLDQFFPFYRWFYDWVPYFAHSRTPSRLFLITHLLLAILAGLGLSLFVRTFRKRASSPATPFFLRTALILICILIIHDLDFFPKIGLCRVDLDQPHHRYLAQQPDNGKTISLPLFPHTDHFASLYELGVMASGRKTLQGYSSVPPVECRQIEVALQPLQEGKMPPELVSFLKEQKVRYIVFHPKLYLRRKGYPDPREVRRALLASTHLLLEKADSQSFVFRFLSEPTTGALAKSIQIEIEEQ